MGYVLNSGVKGDGLPEHLVRPLVENHDIPFFVETGSAGGDSARLASTIFQKVWSIELIEGRAEIKDCPNNVTFLEGDSIEHLPKIISELKELKGGKKRQHVMFYLDAHFCGDTPNETDYPECPVLEEINCIAEYGEDAIIIIDDARLFLGSPPHPNNPTQWPPIADIFSLLKEKFPYHHITITDDYILAISLHTRETIDKEWRDNFYIRYPNEKDKLKQQTKDVYKAFKNYIQE